MVVLEATWSSRLLSYAVAIGETDSKATQSSSSQYRPCSAARLGAARHTVMTPRSQTFDVGPIVRLRTARAVASRSRCVFDLGIEQHTALGRATLLWLRERRPTETPITDALICPSDSPRRDIKMREPRK